MPKFNTNEEFYNWSEEKRNLKVHTDYFGEEEEKDYGE